MSVVDNFLLNLVLQSMHSSKGDILLVVFAIENNENITHAFRSSASQVQSGRSQNQIKIISSAHIGDEPTVTKAVHVNS